MERKAKQALTDRWERRSVRQIKPCLLCEYVQSWKVDKVPIQYCHLSTVRMFRFLAWETALEDRLNAVYLTSCIRSRSIPEHLH